MNDNKLFTLVFHQINKIEASQTIEYKSSVEEWGLIVKILIKRCSKKKHNFYAAFFTDLLNFMIEVYQFISASIKTAEATQKRTY